MDTPDSVSAKPFAAEVRPEELGHLRLEVGDVMVGTRELQTRAKQLVGRYQLFPDKPSRKSVRDGQQRERDQRLDCFDHDPLEHKVLGGHGGKEVAAA